MFVRKVDVITKNLPIQDTIVPVYLENTTYIYGIAGLRTVHCNSYFTRLYTP